MGILNQTPEIFNASSNSAANNRKTHAQERWQAILRYKQDFLQNSMEDPCQYPFMNQDVAASWIRSRNMGVNPYSIVTHPNLNPEKYSEILEKHHLLIEVTNSLVETFKDMILACGDILYLFDNTGVVLLNEGCWEKSHLFPENHPRKGIVANEHSEGTTAHELCIRLGRPVQLLGPEHYCVAFQNCVASAAPIRDESGQVSAALVLLHQPLTEPPGEELLENMCLHSLGLVTSLAIAIETHFKLIKATNDFCDVSEKADTMNCHLQIAMDRFAIIHNTLNTTLTLVDEGIVITNRTGKIIHINQEGMRILKLKSEELHHRNISDFISGDIPVMALADKGDNLTIEEFVSVGSERQLYQICIRPAFNPYTQKLDIVVFKLSPSEKVIAQLSSRAGGFAGNTFENIVGESLEFKKSLTLAQRFAATGENLLIMGESGYRKRAFCPSNP